MCVWSRGHFLFGHRGRQHNQREYIYARVCVWGWALDGAEAMCVCVGALEGAEAIF